jgi:hypothetical protein
MTNTHQNVCTYPLSPLGGLVFELTPSYLKVLYRLNQHLLSTLLWLFWRLAQTGLTNPGLTFASR